MCLCLQSSPHPGMQAAGRTQPCQLSTLLASQRMQGPHLKALSPRAPPPHPPPFPHCPAVTQVPEEVDYRAGATALSACWRPLVVHLRTITTLMGLGGPEQWRTSTLSTKWPNAVFSHLAVIVSLGLDVGHDMGQSVQITGTNGLLVCLGVFFKAIFSFLLFENGGEIMLSSVFKLTNPSVALWLYFKLGCQKRQWTEEKKTTGWIGDMEREI